MFFRKKKQQLTSDDARAYVNFFEESTTNIFMVLGMQARQSGSNNSLDDGLLFDAVEVWHQAIAREQLMTISPIFYGDEVVEKQISDLLTDYERGRLEKFMEGVSSDEFIAKIENATTELLSSDSSSRYADLLIRLVPELEGIIDKAVLEQTAEDLRVYTLAFWRKNGYC